VAVPAGQDERGGAVGSGGNELSNFFAGSVVKKNLEDERIVRAKFQRDTYTLYMDKLEVSRRSLGRVFNSRIGCKCDMHLLHSKAICSNLELKTGLK